MGQLSLQFKVLAEQLNPLAAIVGRDRADVRASRKFVGKAEVAAAKAQAASQKIWVSVAVGDRDGVLENFMTMCEQTFLQIKDDTEAMEKLIIMSMREVNNLKDIKRKNEGNPSNSVIIKGLSKYHDSTEQWFKLMNQRNSFSIYMSDEVSLTSELKHILDPFNLQRDIKKLNKSMKALKKSSKSNPKSRTIQNVEKKILDAFSQNLDAELDKLTKVWIDLIKLIQQELIQINQQNLQLKKTLFELKYPSSDLQKITEKMESVGKQTIKEINGKMRDLNGLIRVELSA